MHMFEGIFKIVDLLICKYLGLEKHDAETPRSVKLYKNKLFLCKNHMFQRHRYHEALDFRECLSGYSNELNKKIGIAAGNAIGKNLIISFEKVEIKKCL